VPLISCRCCPVWSPRRTCHRRQRRCNASHGSVCQFHGCRPWPRTRTLPGADVEFSCFHLCQYRGLRRAPPLRARLWLPLMKARIAPAGFAAKACRRLRVVAASRSIPYPRRFGELRRAVLNTSRHISDLPSCRRRRRPADFNTAEIDISRYSLTQGLFASFATRFDYLALHFISLTLSRALPLKFSRRAY